METSITAAEEDKRAFARKNTALMCGLLDALAALLLFIPAFGDGANSPTAATLLSLAGIAPWTKAAFASAVGLSVVAGIFEVVASRFEKPDLIRISLSAGMALSVIGVAVSIATRQPYAGIFFLVFLVTKGLLLTHRPSQ